MKKILLVYMNDMICCVIVERQTISLVTWNMALSFNMSIKDRLPFSGLVFRCASIS